MKRIYLFFCSLFIIAATAYCFGTSPPTIPTSVDNEVSFVNLPQVHHQLTEIFPGFLPCSKDGLRIEAEDVVECLMSERMFPMVFVVNYEAMFSNIFEKIEINCESPISVAILSQASEGFSDVSDAFANTNFIKCMQVTPVINPEALDCKDNVGSLITLNKELASELLIVDESEVLGDGDNFFGLTSSDNSMMRQDMNTLNKNEEAMPVTSLAVV
ncbi:MAG: hypothetical protein PF542_05340 [Nanoarchaeota archaeon]|nr:hypothetical protein [Nanoarchaeota archaeon]